MRSYIDGLSRRRPPTYQKHVPLLCADLDDQTSHSDERRLHGAFLRQWVGSTNKSMHVSTQKLEEFTLDSVRHGRILPSEFATRVPVAGSTCTRRK